jgi:hypothetical protein
MGWKRIAGREYWYQSERQNGRVVTTYFGGGDLGLLMATAQSAIRHERDVQSERCRAEREAFQAEDRAISEWFANVQAVADAAMASAGFHKHKGQWRRKRVSEETQKLIIRSPEEDTLPELGPGLAELEPEQREVDFFGSSALWLRDEIARKAGGDNLLAQEMVIRKLDQVRAELEGPNPTPIERLLAERASVCWFIAHWYENTFEQTVSRSTIAQADFQQRKIDRAHARFLSAVRTLAQVRKLALPALQLNIAENQVNVQR